MKLAVIGASVAAAAALVAALGASANVLDQTEQPSVPANAPIAIVGPSDDAASSTDDPRPADDAEFSGRPTLPRDTSPTPDVVPEPVSPSDDDRLPTIAPRPTDDDSDDDSDDDDDDRDDDENGEDGNDDDDTYNDDDDD